MNLAMRTYLFWISLLALDSNSMAHLGQDTDNIDPELAAAMDRNETRDARVGPDSRKQATRLLLEFKLREIKNRIDSLGEDSLRVPPEERPRYRRAFLAAAKVLGDAEGRLAEFKRRESDTDSRKWEAMRARMERTLFGLNRYLAETEALWIPAAKPVAPMPAIRDEEL